MSPVAENATITAENVQNSPILSQVDLNAFNRNNWLKHNCNKFKWNKLFITLI